MAETPIVCSLDGHDMKTRQEEWRSVLAPNLVDRSAIPEGVRLVVKRSSGIKEEVERLIALEASCCTWIDWEVREESGSLFVVDATAEQDEGVAVLREWFLPRVAPIPSRAAGS